MTHYRGLECSSLFVLSETEASRESAWDAVAGGLGLLAAGEGAGAGPHGALRVRLQGPDAPARSPRGEWLARTLPGADTSAEHVVKTG